MIVYNFGYRAPLEYDKFVLNIMQFWNAVMFLEERVFASTQQDVSNFMQTIADIDSAYNKLSGENSIATDIHKLKLALY